MTLPAGILRITKLEEEKMNRTSKFLVTALACGAVLSACATYSYLNICNGYPGLGKQIVNNYV